MEIPKIVYFNKNSIITNPQQLFAPVSIKPFQLEMASTAFWPEFHLSMKDRHHFSRMYFKGSYLWMKPTDSSFHVWKQALSLCSQIPHSFYASRVIFIALAIVKQVEVPGSQCCSWHKHLQGTEILTRTKRGSGSAVFPITHSLCLGLVLHLWLNALPWWRTIPIICLNADLWYFIHILNILSSVTPLNFSPSVPNPISTDSVFCKKVRKSSSLLARLLRIWLPFSPHKRSIQSHLIM